MATLVGERAAVQRPLVCYAEEAGWTYLSREDAMRLRRGESDPFLSTVFLDQLQRLNPGVVDVSRADAVARRLARVLPSIEGNLTAWEFIKGLQTVFVDEERRERNLRLIDPDHVEANTFHVTDEFAFTNGTHRIRADVVFAINGVPIILVEAKSATKLNGIADALDQVRRYHEQTPELLAIMQLYALTHLAQFHYGGTWSMGRKGIFNWRDEAAGDFEALVKTFAAPRRVLRVLTDFMLFTRRDGELSKVILRPHQMRAVERVAERALDPNKRRALVWHTQGSGKTFTMITVARRLIEDPAFENPTVLMIVDRNELEDQLFANLESVGLPHVIADSKLHLHQLLRADRRGLIVSTIHKFDGVPAGLVRRQNVYVLVDEAHRTTGGDLGNYLMGALPHATYVGFTGTPIDKTAHGQGTFKVFGVDDERGYLDKYSIRESVADGTTVPLRYSLARNDLLVDRDTLEQEFLALAELEGVSEIEELNRVLDRAVTLKNMLKNPERVQQVAAYVAEHFTSTVQPMGYKAFLVAADREACALYKEALDQHLPPEASAVVISRGPNDGEHLARHHLDEDAEQQIRKGFRKPDSDLRILIVTEKLLTGFDAPILYCLYLDKPMRDHVLLQTIARVNRPFEDDQGRRKPSGFVLDFVGIFDKLERALAFDSQDVQGVVEGLDVLQERFETVMAEARSTYLKLTEGKVADKAYEAIYEHFRDRETREDLYRFFGEVEELYEILSPSPALRPFVSDYDELARIYQAVRAAFDPNMMLDRSFLRKTAELVRLHTTTSEIKAPTRLQKLDAAALDKLAGGDDPETVKVMNLLKALRQIVQEEGEQQLHLIPIGERAEQVAQAFEERQTTSKDALAALEALIGELRQAEDERQASDLPSEAFAVAFFLKREGIAGADVAGREMAAAFERFPHWKSAEAQQRMLLAALYKALIAAKVTTLKDTADRIMQMLERATR